MTNRNLKILIDDLFTSKGKAAVLDKPKQLKHLLFVASKGELGVRNVAIIWILFGSGLRINEVAQLKVKDILSPDGKLVDYFLMPGKYTKTKKPRIVYLFVKPQRQALNVWLKHRSKNDGMTHEDDSFLGLRPDSPLFLSKKGNWRTFAFNIKRYKTDDGIKETQVCSSLENLVRGIIKSAGIKGGSSHSGRRTLATWFYRKGFSLETIRSLLGHESQSMTLEYIEPEITKLRNAYKFLWDEVMI